MSVNKEVTGQVPSCPGLRPLLVRNDRGAGLASPSLAGGFEEFRGVCLPLLCNSACSSRATIS